MQTVTKPLYSMKSVCYGQRREPKPSRCLRSDLLEEGTRAHHREKYKGQLSPVIPVYFPMADLKYPSLIQKIKFVCLHVDIKLERDVRKAESFQGKPKLFLR